MLMFWVDEHMNRQCLTALQQDPCIAVLDFGTQGNRPANSASVVQERCPPGILRSKVERWPGDVKQEATKIQKKMSKRITQHQKKKQYKNKTNK